MIYECQIKYNVIQVNIIEDRLLQQHNRKQQIILKFNEMIEKHAWRQVSSTCSSKPSPRWGHSCCVINQQLVLFGGYAGKYRQSSDSVYMNDIWVYNTATMQWTEVKTTGAIPSHRSNSSLHYDSQNNQLVLFGGGGSNKVRFNAIHLLNWATKVWVEIMPKQDQLAPWERTYHSSQLLYPYLIVYGGEGMADLDDLWVYNIETTKWTEITMEKDTKKPCGRRFHSSCLIGNQFYVIAGCYSKYRPLSDVWRIDFSSLVKNETVEGMRWMELELKSSSFLTRWGHACASLQNNIYIFGGRFSNDLNDVLVIDIDAQKVRTMKTSNQTLPKPRRRACVNFIGNCLLMFGGFNSDYFNDLHFINVSEGLSRPRKYVRNCEQFLQSFNSINKIQQKKMQCYNNNKQYHDLQILTCDNQPIYCHKGIIMQNFQSQLQMNEFVKKISHKQTKQNLIKIIQILYRGYCNNNNSFLIQKYIQYIPVNEQERESSFFRMLQKLKEKSASNANDKQRENIFIRKNMLKITNNNIVQLSDNHFGDFLERNRESTYKDIEIVVNNTYVIKSNSILLQLQSKFFHSLLRTTSQFSKSSFSFDNDNKIKTVYLNIPNGNIVLIEIVLNFLMLGLVIIPQSMSFQSWIELYELADYFSLCQLKSIIVYSIWCKTDEKTVDTILQFSTKQNLTELAQACARYKIRNIQEDVEIQKFGNKYIQQVYIQNKFELKQKIMAKQATIAFKKKVSNASTIQGEKENYQIYNQ